MGDFGRPQIFWPIRRSILYFAWWRLVIASSLFVSNSAAVRTNDRVGARDVLRIAPSSVPGVDPEPTGLAPKRRAKPRVAKHRAGPSGPRSGRFLRRSRLPGKRCGEGG